MLIADELSTDAYRAALPAAGWKIATPSPDANSSIHTSAYPGTPPALPRPRPARLTPAPAIQLRGYRSTMNPTTSCGSAAPNVAPRGHPDAPTNPYCRPRHQ